MRDKILVVDDTRLNREFLKNILEDEYEIIQAQNGKEALLILKKQYQEIVLVILDLVMSDVDGFAVLEVMRRYKWLEVTPVIVMSGQNSSDAERKSLAMGASDFIRKPLDNYLVRRRVKNIADLYSYRRSLEKRVAKQTGSYSCRRSGSGRATAVSSMCSARWWSTVIWETATTSDM